MDLMETARGLVARALSRTPEPANAAPTLPMNALVQRVSFIKDPIGFLERSRALGDVFRVKLSRPGWFFVTRPEHVREMYTTHRSRLLAGEAKKPLFGQILGGTSSLLLDGKAHQERRRLLYPTFQASNFDTLAPAITTLAAQHIAGWPRGEALPIYGRLNDLLFDVICHILFGADPGVLPALAAPLKAYLEDAAGSKLVMLPPLQKDLGPFSPWGKVMQRVRAAEHAVEAALDRRTEAHDGDLVSKLMAARDDAGKGLTRDQLVHEVLTMLVAGHEITTAVLTWLLHAIVTRPELEARLLAELDDVSGGRPIDAAIASSLPLLHATMKESLRFYSTVPTGSARLCTEDFELGGYTVRKGMTVCIALHLLHRDPDTFERPDDFLPERFSDGRDDAYGYAPFGGGDRRCLGMGFAQAEIKVVVANVLRALRVTPEQRHLRAVRRGAFLVPEGGLAVRLRDR